MEGGLELPEILKQQQMKLEDQAGSWYKVWKLWTTEATEQFKHAKHTFQKD